MLLKKHFFAGHRQTQLRRSTYPRIRTYLQNDARVMSLVSFSPVENKVINE